MAEAGDELFQVNFGYTASLRAILGYKRPCPQKVKKKKNEIKDKNNEHTDKRKNKTKTLEVT